MPLINIKMGHISEEKKKELIVNLTNEAVKITGLKPENFMVFIEEFSYENIGVAGMTVKERLAGAK
ncbi:MAG TPA: tautomerase family protein [Spirochaetota bacterium]|jgi:4-oxalocrotonate tautomerase family enzyme|nr:tautomerase family protein [Spirochaetota bacterium]HPY04383.1 tautomerase family protein [Spirochaetota bacterium]HQA53819.1 tautomerase family protein [Spirochaetota bacterium]